MATAKKAAKKASKKTARKAVKKATKKAAAKKVVAKKAAARKPAAGKVAAKKVVAKKAVAKKAVAKKAAAKKPAAKKAIAKKPAAKKAAKTTRKSRPITPAAALRNTRALLEAKQAHDREAPPWQQIGQGAHAPEGGWQSDEARVKANERHLGEMDAARIQGSISTHDRHSQGKRDARG